MNKLSKIIISSGLGGKTSKQIADIKEHFQSIFEPYCRGRNAAITKCRKSIALFKVREGTNMGIKITIRKKERKELLNHLLKIHSNFYQLLHYDSNSLSLGVPSHRKLKLENYNHKAPEYGFVIQFIFEPQGSRIKYRRINPLKLKRNIDSTMCIRILKEYVEY